jgi:hypothetical protein
LQPKKGAEWKDLHHIDEDKLDDIANRTKLGSYQIDGEYNKPERLVFLTKTQHYWAHWYIHLIRCRDDTIQYPITSVCSGGPIWLFWNCVDMLFYSYRNYLKNLQATKKFHKECAEVVKHFILNYGKVMYEWKSFDILTFNKSFNYGNEEYKEICLELTKAFNEGKMSESLERKIDEKAAGK